MTDTSPSASRNGPERKLPAAIASSMVRIAGSGSILDANTLGSQARGLESFSQDPGDGLLVIHHLGRK